MVNIQNADNFNEKEFIDQIECPYPEPYALTNNGLFIYEQTNKGEEYRFISNFLPIIDTVIEYDNGKTVEKNYLVKGFMHDGRELPIVTVDSSELLTLNRVVSKWDASCIIGTQYNAKERLRFALQTTTENAKRRLQCREKIGSKVHARVADTVACFRIGFDYYIRFLSFCFPTVDLEIYREEFEKVIMKLAEEQGNYTEQDRPTHLFIRKLMAMIECGEVWLMRPNISGDPVSGCVGYESEEYYEIFFEQAFKQVMKFCEGQSVNFTISPQALSKDLAEEGIIYVKNGQNTYTKRYGGNVRRRVMCIKKSEVKNIYGE